MKFVNTLLMLFLPAGLLAGAWTGAHPNHPGEAFALMLFVHKPATLSLTLLNALEQITEPAGLLLLGTCLVLMAWFLHRRRGRTGA
jgi:hypothetical protein